MSNKRSNLLSKYLTCSVILVLLCGCGWIASAVSCPSLRAAELATSAAQVQKDEEICYVERGPQRLLLDVYRPVPGTSDVRRPRRAVLLVHGGGWYTGSRRSGTVSKLARALAEHGFVAFSIDYRLVHDDSATGEIANTYPAALDDCQYAVRWIRAHASEYQLDASAIGAAGDSAGGNLVSLLGTRDTRDLQGGLNAYSSRVQAVINLYGPTDVTCEFSQQRPSGAVVQQMVDRWLPRQEDRRAASALHGITPQAAPTLLFHGVRDPLIPVSQARDYQRALRDAGRPVELIEFEEEKHGFSQPRQEEVAARAVQFFRKWLGD